MKISLEIFNQRRKALLARMPQNSAMLIAAATLKNRNADAEFPFRQDSDFYYLTGFNEPDALLLLQPGSKNSVTIFCLPRDPDMEIWTGYRAGPEGCLQTFGADQAFTLDQVDDEMPKLLNGIDQLLYPFTRNSDLDRRVKGWLSQMGKKVRAGIELPKSFADSGRLVHEMRLIKSDAEVELMQRAADISAQAHCLTMQTAKAGMNEYQLEAVFLSYCMQQGARNQAYTPIVAGGQNSCILHYIENNQTIKEGALVLIDAGCELDNYASDITRTFPVTGRFSKEQAAIYDIVLKANLACIAQVKPGFCWNDLHELSVKLLTEGLVELGLLSGEVDQLIESGAYRRFYMHRIGHWLGMDVHDVGSYRLAGQWRDLEPGMITTIEPGIYIAPDDASVEERWRGIGIRIEDDVLVTKDGCRVLSSGVPKARDEIEALMQHG